MKRATIVAAAAATLLHGEANARAVPEGPPPALIQRLVECRQVKDPAARLTCLDREAGAIAAAIESKQIVVVDRERARSANRSVFGFASASLSGIFGRSSEVNQIEASVLSVSRNADGGVILGLDDGSLWSQTDDRIFGRDPKRGTKVTVTRGALGSYYVSGPGIGSFKARRVG